MRFLSSSALMSMLAVACHRGVATPAVAPMVPAAVDVGASRLPTAVAGQGAMMATDSTRPSATTSAAATNAATTDAATANGARPGASSTPRVSGDSVSTAEVALESARVFGGAAPPVATDSIAGRPLWDIDVRSYETRTRVEDYVRIFSGRAKGVFETALQRQTRYGPMIRARLRAVGLPENMTYLALVESWFNPHAYSTAAAVGVWQFMAGTGRGMGLRVDWWVDERRDPVRSTEAAARLLKSMRDQFGSLYLAAAAYNGGEGRVSRGLARYAGALEGVEGDDRFFALADKSYLRRETRDYVPKIIAAALVGEEPARYGVHVDSVPPYAYDSVRVPGATPLAAVANAMGLENADISELNPHVLRGMTPPTDSLWVRVPVGRATNFDERFSALEVDERRALTKLESKKGQSMASIARAHGITAKQLAWYNPKVAKLKSGTLLAGQMILVPRRDVVALARDIPNPSVERYPKRRAVRRVGAKTTTTHAAKGKAKAGSAAGKAGTKSSTKKAVKKPS
jgi:membrane-bound lytic murein transglycosylase D